jgi:amidase
VVVLCAGLSGPIAVADEQGAGAQAKPKRRFELATATIADIQSAFDAGALTSERLLGLYLARIEAYDRKGPEIRAFLHVNPHALADARALDAERKAKGPRSPVHGVPVVFKGMFDVVGLPTTGGALPRAGVEPTKDACVVRRLRDAGAVILGKVNASSFGPVATKNPYDLTRIPGFSSSGTGAAVAAWFTTIGLGSETGFSVRTPSSDCNLFGISTTSGLISRDGDLVGWVTGGRPGPMARSVHDLAVTLDVIAGFDVHDLWTAHSLGKMPAERYVTFLRRDGLRGVRAGVLKDVWAYAATTPEGLDLAARSVRVFSENGAVLVHGLTLGVDLEETLSSKPDGAFPSRFESVAGLELYLARQGPGYPFRRPVDLLGHPDVQLKPAAEARLRNPPDLDRDPEYRGLLENREAMRKAVVDLMDKHRLDVLIYPHKLFPPTKLGPKDEGPWANQLSSLTSLPSLVVPSGFSPDGLPFGFEILGRPWSEPTLFRVASGFEAVTKNRRSPPTTPPLPGEVFDY